MTKSTWLVLSLAMLAVVMGANAQDRSSSDTRAVSDPRSVSLAFTDGSHLKALLAEEQIELQTPHGKLVFPIADIQRIEFAQRTSVELTLAIDKDISDLGSDEYRVREKAMANLLERKEKSFAPLARAARQQNDLEMRQRIEHLLEKLRAAVPEEQLNVRLNDIVHTAESKIAGKLLASSFKISSSQFGPLQVKLADIRELKSQAAGPPLDEIDPKNILADPGNMRGHEAEIGKSFAFRVTGAQHGSCYGTDVYTTDSTIATAAVHMGLLKPGETGVLVATIIGSPAGFVSSTRHGITSSQWSSYPAGFTLRKAKLAADVNGP
ncbi:LCCL domain protein [Anatilimnocola aggregata]|uniref:LCCL domain protein n=1 Tax=Anatilimnocola aggregata TaxID=2528021 RepID=A0A517YNE1_9BACT|nr:LCCL domain-containing protein [Anatilimnocola aggregata]QDU31738.1 LCCL domain protein [Anatilimnocola aggregata]